MPPTCCLPAQVARQVAVCSRPDAAFPSLPERERWWGVQRSPYLRPKETPNWVTPPASTNQVNVGAHRRADLRTHARTLEGSVGNVIWFSLRNDRSWAQGVGVCSKLPLTPH